MRKNGRNKTARYREDAALFSSRSDKAIIKGRGLHRKKGRRTSIAREISALFEEGEDGQTPAEAPIEADFRPSFCLPLPRETAAATEQANACEIVGRGELSPVASFAVAEGNGRGVGTGECLRHRRSRRTFVRRSVCRCREGNGRSVGTGECLRNRRSR